MLLQELIKVNLYCQIVQPAQFTLIIILRNLFFVYIVSILLVRQLLYKNCHNQGRYPQLSQHLLNRPVCFILMFFLLDFALHNCKKLLLCFSDYPTFCVFRPWPGLVGVGYEEFYFTTTMGVQIVNFHLESRIVLKWFLNMQLYSII